MNLHPAIRLTEILLALAFLQQSIEYLYTERNNRILFSLRIFFSWYLRIKFVLN